MYRKEDARQLKFENFYLPFGGKLRSDNRWVILAGQIPWQAIEQTYGQQFCDDNGAAAKPARMALGALIIKERLGVTDRETVEQIRENPYLQYFLGLSEYTEKEPFHHSMMTHFRKRFDQAALAAINQSIVDLAMTPKQEKAETLPEDDDTPSNQGKLIVDATCTPADVAYPTDLNLLNEAREKTEEIIDAMHAPWVGHEPKPRTYRQEARKAYLAVAKQKKPGVRKIRKAIGQQLRYLRRNLVAIEQMASMGRLKYLGRRRYRLLLVVQELYRQQQWMYENQIHSVSHRIISLSQPHVRPIVRGKAKSPVEFGAKVSISLVKGFSFVEKIGWDPYNESCDLIEQIEHYRQQFGGYPESVHADQIYKTRENRTYCQSRGIRLSGPALGRPTEDAEQLKMLQAIRRQDEIDRIPIEGKFGQGKRRFTLARIMAKLAITSEAVIMVSFMVMNLEKILNRILFLCLFVVQDRLAKRLRNCLERVRWMLNSLPAAA
jgi:IS5 family transposase